MTLPEHSAEIVTDQSADLKRSETRAEQRPKPWRLQIGDWSTLEKKAAPIRLEVFVHEQRVPLEEEIDALDAVCVHAVAFDADDRALATGRLLPDGHIGRMAVLKAARGQGLGSAVLKVLLEQAQNQGFAEVVLSAQTHAQEFYARHGFVPEGAVYLDANIPHILMRKALPGYKAP
jgi:predicted GNAT family N-acyltransferase